jgi:tetratricopeptide (TPR) repeat protein
MARARAVDLSVVPVEPGIVWHGGLMKFPSWIEPREEEEPFRPWLAGWCDAESGISYPPSLGEEPERSAELLVEALRETVRKAGPDAFLPGRLQVTDPDDADVIRAGVAGTAVIVEVVERVDAFTRLRDALRERQRQDTTVPGLIDGEGIDVEMVRSFAEAGAAFFEAEPWEQFDDQDLIEIDCDLADPKMRLAVIMGSAGTAFGIFFMESQEQHESILSGEEEKGRIIRMGGDWGMTFVPAYDIPIADHDLWEDHDLPLADPFAYPSPVRVGPGRKFGRPTARQMVFMEGLMRALTASTDDEIDTGTWEKSVSTSQGPVTIGLSLPKLLADEEGGASHRPGMPTDRRALERGIAEIQRFMSTQEFESAEQLEAAIREKFTGRSIDEFPSTAQTPLEAAQELAYRAFDASGRMRVKLARQALAVSPDCADAYGILAERSTNPEKIRKLLEQGIAAGERAIQSVGIEGNAIEWADVRCRPYLRMRFAYAVSLSGFGETDAAISHLEELLRIDEEDHQGVRYRMMRHLLEEKRDGEAIAVLDRFPQDVSSMWPYARALLAYRAAGDTPQANDLADRAIKTNPFVWKFLAGTQRLEEDIPDDVERGSRGEAIAVAQDLLDPWEETPGACEWIRVRGRSRSKGGKSGGGKSSGGGKGKRKKR